MRCEHDTACTRPATLYHTTRHADCHPGYPVGVTVAVCDTHSYTRSETYTRLVPHGTVCPYCGLPITYPTAIHVTPIQERTRA